MNQDKLTAEEVKIQYERDSLLFMIESRNRRLREMPVFALIKAVFLIFTFVVLAWLLDGGSVPDVNRSVAMIGYCICCLLYGACQVGEYVHEVRSRKRLRKDYESFLAQNAETPARQKE